MAAAEDNFVVDVFDDDCFAEKKRLVCSTVRRAAAPLDDIILGEIITYLHSLIVLDGQIEVKKNLSLRYRDTRYSPPLPTSTLF